MRRRRFLALAAVAPLAARSAPPPPLVWRGVALGAAAAITLPAHDRARAEAALTAARAAIGETEALFSLYRPDGALARLNAAGALPDAPAPFRALLGEARAVSAATEGFFDPTVQPVWTAHATGGDVAAARRRVGWRDLHAAAGAVRFARPGMAATFNGIAQGWAADRALAALRAHGFADALAHVGEFAGSGRRPGGGDWRVGVPHPLTGALIATPALSGRAAATSAPDATRVGPGGAAHVFDPVGAAGPRLAQVTVIAETAARADALSTAVAAAPAGLAAALLRAGGAEAATLVSADGDVRRWRP